ncbi:transcriptional regulator [Chitinophagaceae bacterium IBVUCB2]|nr:transcriptional regulator [Chitinophagaceae bacterium IBVUCB2]
MQKKILIIEDNPDIMDNISEILQLDGYEILKAQNGKQGVETAINNGPDLIICDIMMPVMDGYAVLHMLQKNEKLQNTPFVFLSAKNERTDIRKGMQLGADDYISKPFDPTDLLNVVEVRLKKSESLKKTLGSDNLENINELLHFVGEGKTLEEFSNNRKIKKYSKKETVYTEGSHPHSLYYLLQGKIKTFKRNDDGKDLIVDLYGESDFCGYIALLESTVYKESAEVLEDAEVAIIPREEFELLVYRDKQVANKFFKMLAKSVTEKENRLLGQAYNSLRKKVAVAVLTLKDKYHINKEEVFSINMSRENIASIAGTATESLIRTLSDFKNEKLIDIREVNIIITDETKLRALVSN